MIDALSYVGALLAAVAALIKYVAARVCGRPRTRAFQLLLLGLALLSASLTLSAPLTVTLAASLDPVPNLTRLLSNTLAMGAAYCVLVLSTVASAQDCHPRRRAVGHATVLILGVLTMTVLLVGADTEHTTTFVATYGRDPLIDLYLAIYAGYMCWGMITFHRLGHRYFHEQSVTIIARAGFRVIGVGLFFGYMWVVSRAVDVIAQHAGWTITPSPMADSTLLTSICAGLLAVGVTFPEWVPLLLRTRVAFYLRGPIVQVRVAVALAQLNLLWRPLVEAFPEVVVNLDGQSDATRLYRRIIEIRDVQLRLSPYVHPDAQLAAAELAALRPDRERSLALFEAAALATGLDAYRVQHRYPNDEGPAINYVDYERILGNPLDEARHLASVALAFRCSRTIRTVRQRLQPRPGQPTVRFALAKH